MKIGVTGTAKHWWRSWQKHPTVLWVFSLLWLLSISWLAFLWHLGSTGLVDETEPLFAEAARQMLVTGDWITPYFNGETRFDKPPLIYWLIAIAYKLIGVNEWAVRLPSALSAIGLMGMGFYTLRRFGLSRPATLTATVDTSPSTTTKLQQLNRQRWLSAWIGAALIALNFHTLIWARTGVSDMLLSGCMGSALLAFFIGYASEDSLNSPANRPPTSPLASFVRFLFPASGWYLACYVLIALAILAKGPIGFVLPALIITGFLLYLGNIWQVWREMCLLRGLILIAVLALPWYILVTYANGMEYINSFFGYHNIQRFTEVVNDHSAPWYFYILVVLVGFAPHSSYLPLAIARLRFWQREQWQRSPRSSQLSLFALAWFVGIFGFFTVAVTKLPSYVLPLMPAAAILVALLWSDLLTRIPRSKTQPTLKRSGRPGRIIPAPLPPCPPIPPHIDPLLLSGLFNVLIVFALAGAILSLPEWLGDDPAAPNFSEQIQASGLLWPGSLIWMVTGAVLLLLLLVQPWRRWLWCVNILGFAAFVLVALLPMSFVVDQVRQLPLRQLSTLAVEVQQADEELMTIGFQKPSVVFYAQQQVHHFNREKTARNYIEQAAITPAESPSFLVLARPKRIEKARLQPDEYTVIRSAGPYELIRVSKSAVAQRLSADEAVD